MLIRILLLVGLAAGLFVIVRSFALPMLARARTAVKLLGVAEIERLTALAAKHAPLAEALKVRETMKPLVTALPNVAIAVDEAVRLLVAELELRERIIAALAENTESRRAAAERRARAQLGGAEGTAKVSLEETIEALVRQKQQILAVGARREALTASIEKTVVDLRELQLALLDAAGVSGNAEIVSARLRTAKDGLAGISAAHDEIADFLKMAEQSTALPRRGSAD